MQNIYLLILNFLVVCSCFSQQKLVRKNEASVMRTMNPNFLDTTSLNLNVNEGTWERSLNPNYRIIESNNSNGVVIQTTDKRMMNTSLEDKPKKKFPHIKSTRRLDSDTKSALMLKAVSYLEVIPIRIKGMKEQQVMIE